ncbi:MAG TPA: hypothetical protein VIK47_07560 [Kiloniellales bacterium]
MADHRRFVQAILRAGLLAGLLAACDSGEVSPIAFDEVRQAAADPAGFKAYFDGVKGKRIAWQGQVVEARREFEDDYMQTGMLLVDMDAAERPGADVAMKFPTARLEEFKPGQAVTFTAILREYQFENGALLLKLEMKELQ